MRSVIFLLFIVVATLGSPGAYGQIVKSIQPPPGNAAVAVEHFEWTTSKEQTRQITLAFTVKNKTENRTIRFVQLSLTALDKSGITLQDNGTTLRKLSKAITIAPGETETLLFEKNISANQVDNVQVKQILVEFTNGSLEILQ